MDDDVKVERRGAVRWLTINREERRNAINQQVLASLAQGIRDAQADREARAIVLTGAGDKVFSAGADLKPGAAGDPFQFDPSQPQHPLIELFKVMEACNLPIIARVNGHALGGGFGLVCACDLAVAVEEARLGTPEVRVGVFPAMILPYLLRVVPRRVLLEMCITGEPITAKQGALLHIVNAAVAPDQLDLKLSQLLERIELGSPSAIRLGKHGFHAVQDMTIAQALEFMQMLLQQIARTEDAREGMRAFNERRPARWSGR